VARKNSVLWDVRRVTPIITDVSEEGFITNIRVKRISELGATLAVTSNRSTLQIYVMIVLLRSVLRLLVAI
jgi:hypothetical protein